MGLYEDLMYGIGRAPRTAAEQLGDLYGNVYDLSERVGRGVLDVGRRGARAFSAGLEDTGEPTPITPTALAPTPSPWHRSGGFDGEFRQHWTS